MRHDRLLFCLDTGPSCQHFGWQDGTSSTKENCRFTGAEVNDVESHQGHRVVIQDHHAVSPSLWRPPSMKRFHERRPDRIVVGRSVKTGVPKLTA